MSGKSLQPPLSLQEVTVDLDSGLTWINKLCFKHFETVFVFHTPSLQKPIWNSSPGSLGDNVERQLGR